ncbi:O-acetylhomoserine (thiol)-lyase [Nitratiruptor sp. YY08-26]|uniref:aminotransferase class I/II-fold pyridoxal phosphate-dependent enzyme n=1 Tax=unclassified Nitratiruptor TaxID=2624044 RepID=UPI0019158609|nr:MULTISPECIES: aminotransferase class I/II-fold pyridoxal phosphate-dependent enzyme [unclassified Nitratiruptor]BCD62578.1 O-acetylhomoserine (thiol)-lyase [Nitratiruptor sp. YY08-13]BCD66514.1 O-acetylhomoserine (thiol)-lyase [Nitratiruptor sp. YY08-26]
MNNFERFQTFVLQQSAAKDGAISPPIIGSAAFSYGDPKSAEAVFAGESRKPLYARMGNPTNAKLETLLAAIDQGDGAVVTSSGMGAIAAVVSAFLQSGDEIICVGGLFGGTYAFFTQNLPRFGIKVRFFRADEEVVLSPQTKMIFCESVGNPSLTIVNFAKLGKLAQKYGVLFVVDNTITPLLFEPFSWGADIIVYSATKVISGQSQALGGAIIYKEPRKDLFIHFPFLKNFYENLGKDAIMGVIKKRALRDFGMSMQAHAAYLTILGLETLPLRIQRATGNAQKLFLALKDKVKVLYAKNEQYFPFGTGQMMGLDFKSKEDAFTFLEHAKIPFITANIGDSRTLALHMRSTIYRDFQASELEYLGVSEGLVRVSVGLENCAMIIEDFENTLRKVQ